MWFLSLINFLIPTKNGTVAYSMADPVSAVIFIFFCPNLFPNICNHPLHACLLSCFSHIRLFATLWTVGCQAPLSMGFSMQEYWSGLPCPSSGDLPVSGIKPVSLLSPAVACRLFTTSATWEALNGISHFRGSLAEVFMWASCFLVPRYHQLDYVSAYVSHPWV